MTRKKLNYEGRSGYQQQSDYLHHSQKNVMTRGQVDNAKSKYPGSKSNSYAANYVDESGEGGRKRDLKA